MNIFEKREELIGLVEAYLHSKSPPNRLNDFAWDVIESFSSIDQSSLPSPCEFEPAFWNIVFLIQHLAVEDDEGLLRAELEQVFPCLVHQIPLPPGYDGHRP